MTVARSKRLFMPAPARRLRVERRGHSILRSAGVPRPVVLVDSRERQPWRLAQNHPNWIAAERRVALKAGDYSVEGMADLLAIERKSLADLVNCTVASRSRFIACCERLSKLRWKAILVEATYEDVKAGWEDQETESRVHPNAVCGTLDAIEAKFAIPVIYTSRHRALATERAASWLSKHFTYWWLETHGYGRTLIDLDKL